MGSLLALVMIPGGATLDWFLNPDQFTSLLLMRLACDAALLPVVVLLFTGWGIRFVRWFSAWLVVAPAIMIAAMIYVTSGPASPYYAGLTLMMMITCTLMLYRWWEAAGYCAFVLFAYFGVCFAHSGLAGFGLLVGHGFFLLLTASVGITVCYYDSRRRFDDFALRHALDRQNRELHELDKLKSDFLANVSHELGTPLTLILSPVETMIQYRPPLPEQVGQWLTLVRANVRRLQDMIGDLLNVVNLESAGKDSVFVPLDLRTLVVGLVSSIDHYANKRQLTVVSELVEDEVIVVGDRSELEKIILNLLTNAVKFTPPGGKIMVRLRVEDQTAKVAVEDTGPGIAAEDLPHIFERFHRLEETKNAPGWGLGLAVAKELADKHEAQLKATSVFGQGATFTLSLPTANEPNLPDRESSVHSQNASERLLSHSLARIASSEVTAPTITGKRDRVVVIDDEPAMLEYLVSLLSPHYDLFLAQNGEQGLQAIQAHRPSVVLLDMMLPDVGGLEVAENIRKMEEQRDTKILMLTARVDEGSKIAALKSGADDFVNKPFSATELTTRIDNLLNTQKLQSNLRQGNHELRKAIDKLTTTQSQLIQSEKMNALGALSGGLLHEILNPLNYGKMAVKALKKRLPENSKQLEILADIEESRSRIEAIITDLRAFAHPETNENRHVFPLKAAINSALQFTSHEMKSIEVVRSTDDSIHMVGSQSQITQVLVNLLANAAHSVAGSNGKAACEIADDYIASHAPPRIEIETRTEAGKIMILVSDNGGGIEEDMLTKIFDPFVSTKQPGDGIGLGLSICHTIVANHDGKITPTNILNEKGERTGARFTLMFPSLEE